MRFTKGLIAAAALMLGSSGAYASSTNPGYIFNINPESNGVVIFNVTNTGRSAAPACANLYFQSSFTINATTPAGQAKLSTLLTAYALHKQIYISGTGSCADWGDRESVDWFTTIYDQP